MPPPIAAALVLSFPALVLVAALKDVISFTIPNWISLALLAIFPVAALAAGLPFPAIGLHVAVGVGGLALGLVMFALRLMGGGDAKLIAAVSLWLGLAAMPQFLAATAMAGGALAITVLAMRSAAMRPVVLMGPRWVLRLAEPREGIPYGVAIAVGALAAFPTSPLAAALGF